MLQWRFTNMWVNNVEMLHVAVFYESLKLTLRRSFHTKLHMKFHTKLHMKFVRNFIRSDTIISEVISYERASWSHTSEVTSYVISYEISYEITSEVSLSSFGSFQFMCRIKVWLNLLGATMCKYVLLYVAIGLAPLSMPVFKFWKSVNYLGRYS